MMEGSVAEIFFSASVLESHFYDPAGNAGVCERKIGQPIMYI
jgi:hypothetical protein